MSEEYVWCSNSPKKAQPQKIEQELAIMAYDCDGFTFSFCDPFRGCYTRHPEAGVLIRGAETVKPNGFKDGCNGYYIYGYIYNIYIWVHNIYIIIVNIVNKWM